MATNIGTLGTFHTTNMKPASGEIVDSLWGQNIGDTLGALWEEERLVMNTHVRIDAQSTPHGTWFFKRGRIPRNLLIGTLWGTSFDHSEVDVYTGTLFIDGTQVAEIALNPANDGGDVEGFSHDTSGYDYNTDYEISLLTTETGNLTKPPSITISVWERP